MAREFTFGAGPERLKRLLFEGLEEPEGQEDVTKSQSDDTTKPGDEWIGRYRLIRTIGEGGMGIVYLAEQQETIRRKVALKVIKPGMDSKRVIARFEAERQALALLDHPNIAHVYDAGTTEAGRPYFVMEYVKGTPITEFCDRHTMNIEQRLRLFQQVCGAIQHAHQKGIIHRDIKPSNILVSMQDDKAVPKIIDFGVAKALSHPLTERTLATEESQLLGTPEYMSPEQADMATEDIDTRSDIYSLGVLLYVLLTGVLPFDSDTLREGGLENIRQIIRETDPKTPSTRLVKLGIKAKKLAENRRTEIKTLAKHLRKELEWIPLKAMRKERSERYRSASELADDIENYLKGAPLIAGPPSTIYKLKKFTRRNRVLVGGIAAVITVLVAGIVVSTIFAVHLARSLSENQLIVDFLENDLLSADQVNLDETKFIYVPDNASKSLTAGKFKDKPLIEARMCLILGKTYTRLGEYEKGEQHIRRATEIYRQQLGQKHPDTLNAMGSIAWICHKQGRSHEMEQIYTRVLQLGQGVLNVKEQVGIKNMLGAAYLGLGKHKQAELLYDEILQIVQSELGGEHPILPWFKKNLAVSYLNQGRYVEAEQGFKELIRMKIDTEDLGPADFNLKMLLGVTYKEQGRYGEAEKLLKDALKEIRMQLGDKHPQILPYMLSLSQLHIEQERYEEAEKLLLEAIDGPCVKLGDTHPRTLKLINNLIDLYEAWGKPEKAKEWRAKLSQMRADEH
jgi:serine/threonine protein kinase/Flp pilus assembly protein TadD